MAGISNFQHLNKSSMLKKGSRMNLDVALSVVQLKRHKPETKAAVAMAVKNARCSQLFALLTEKIRWFLSNCLVKNLYIAASALYPRSKSLRIETFPGLMSLGGFFVVARGERRPPREGYGTRRLPAEHSSLRGECPVDSSLFYDRLSMLRQRAYPRSFESPVSLVTTGQLAIRSIKQPSTLY